MSTSKDATRLLEAVTHGDDCAAGELMPHVYEQLRQLADGYLRRERKDHTLQPTALVHEAYLKLIDQKKVAWQGETHFKAVAAQAMRRILIDYARSHKREKRGGNWRRLSLNDALVSVDGPELDPVSLNEVLQKMSQVDERQARVVELRIFGGLANEGIAAVLDVSLRTVERDWTMGRTWLRRELRRGASDDE